MYRNYIKRFLDLCIALFSLIVLSPLLLVLIVVGACAMNGNPFFVQKRPGKDERIFNLIKFRTMNNAMNDDGNLLPDEIRLTSYGQFLRSTSLDELPELFNILKGDMAIVGPRPLLVRYLERYNKVQRRRHEVRPGLTGLAQVNGRNAISWNDKFKFDVEYIDNISFIGDCQIIIKTIKNVVTRKGISSETCATMEEFMGNE